MVEDVDDNEVYKTILQDVVRVQQTVEAVKRSWASIVEKDDGLPDPEILELPIREVDGRKRLFILRKAYKKMLRPFAFSAIATLMGEIGRGGRSLVANRWKPGQAMKLDAKSKVVDSSSPKFPAKLWNVRMFNDIASLIGASFVGVDAYTRGFKPFWLCSDAC
ncbi:uncharacterized protein LOC116263850 [Nymphaea colorata]|uniref:uncharacterized protein LOC116263850 n=1 Tax=Nymphaea colorata TaxID=210225 RepID=UPI00129EE9F9|nr:uncharacterized protein LOC116263850 [Nymphaea colorata]